MTSDLCVWVCVCNDTRRLLNVCLARGCIITVLCRVTVGGWVAQLAVIGPYSTVHNINYRLLTTVCTELLLLIFFVGKIAFL